MPFIAPKLILEEVPGGWPGEQPVQDNAQKDVVHVGAGLPVRSMLDEVLRDPVSSSEHVAEPVRVENRVIGPGCRKPRKSRLKDALPFASEGPICAVDVLTHERLEH